MGRQLGWVLGLGLVLGTVASGADRGVRSAPVGWSDGLFAETSHDFGPVPRGAKVRHAFVLTNRLAEPLTILDVRASCGCTTGRATAGVLAPGASAAIEAEMDTRNFVGKKATVLYVSLVTASGREGETRLGVSSTILSDVVLNPGTADFGVVARGQGGSQTITIDRVGMPNWQITRMISGCKAVDATLSQVARNGQMVTYALTITLKSDAPSGPIRDEIRLMTNDRETPIFPVQILGAVKGDLTASPSVVAMTKSGAGVEGKFLLRSSRPFALKGVEGAGDGFTVVADDAKEKAVHMVVVKYQGEAGKAPADPKRVFRVSTSLADEGPVELTVDAAGGALKGRWGLPARVHGLE